MSTITSVPSGQSATTVLRDVLVQSQAGNPLAATTVIVRTATQAVYVRRALALAGGVAGVAVVSSHGFVQQEIDDALLKIRRRPASSLQIRAAIQAELIDNPRSLTPVSSHPKTLQRLVDLAGSIRYLPADIRENMAGAASGMARDSLLILTAAEQRLTDWLLPDELLEIALEQDLGREPILWFQPYPATPLEGRLLAATAQLETTHVVAALSGSPTFDDGYRRLLSGWGVRLAPRAGSQSSASWKERPTKAERVEVSDPSDEVQVALRRVLDLAADGVPLASIAVLYPRSDPYASLLTQQLDSAGIPFSGPSPSMLSSTAGARLLLRLVDVVTSKLERSSVVRFLYSAPVIGPNGDVVPAADWDSLSRQAGVIDGSSWQNRLAELSSSCQSEEDEPSSTEAEIEKLMAFVEDLDQKAAESETLTTWEEWSSWFLAAVEGYVPSVENWPEHEQAGYHGLLQTLNELSGLDEILPSPSIEQFRSMLLSELDRRPLPANPYGKGLLVTSVAAAAGLEFEQVVIVGLADGSFPRVVSEDPLLNDQLRSVAGHHLVSSRSVEAADAWMVGSAVVGSTRQGILLQSRSELRSGRTRRWPTTLETMVDQTTVVDSHFQGFIEQGRPVSIEDVAVRELAVHTVEGEPLGSHPLSSSDRLLARGLARESARRESSINAHTGKLIPQDVSLADRSLSPTALETYARCPRRFLLERVFRASEIERPERVDELSARDRGSLFHTIVERFVSEALTANRVPEPEEPWSDDQVTRLFELGSEEITSYYERGLSGGRVQTAVAKRTLNATLRKFVETDNDLRSTHKSTPVAVEYSFGFGSDVKVFELRDGRQVRLRGSVDRVDTTADGGVLVIDYKTGSSRGYTKMSSDPLDDGRRLQLPVYGSVVAEELGDGGDHVAMYWMTRDAKQLTVDLDETVYADMKETVDDLLHGIEQGYFPAVPGDVVGYPRVTFENCVFCPYDMVCPQDRQREWSVVNPDGSTLREFLRGDANGQ